MIFENRKEARKYIKRRAYMIVDESVKGKYGEFVIRDRSMNKCRVVYKNKEKP